MPRVKARPSADLDMANRRHDLARTRFVARALADTIPVYDRKTHAALFTREALRTFAETVAPGYMLRNGPMLIGELDSTTLQLAEGMGRVAASLPFEEGARALTSLYTVMLDGKERSELGAFYTPAALTERLVDMAEEGGIDWKIARVLDPASGGGTFLLAVMRRMRAAMAGAEPAFVLAQLGTRLSGFEIDAHAAQFSQVVLDIALWDLAEKSGREIPSFITIGDTLEMEAVPSFDLVIGNPPYGRVSLTPAQRERYGRSLYGHANLYGVFTDIAVRWVKPQGLIAYLTPTSVLGGQYYAALRRLLALEAPPVAIDFVHARKDVFEDVLQETLLALYQRGAAADPFQVHYLDVDSEREAHLTKNGKVGLPADPTAPWLAPRSPHHVKIIAAAKKMQARLADWGYDVSTGPLVWNRFKPQLKHRPSAGTLPLIWAESVTPDGRFMFRAEKRNHAPHFKIEPRDAWLVTTRGCVLLQRTTSKEQSRRLIAAELPDSFIGEHGGVVVENHLNMVRPFGKPKVSPAAVAAVLNSGIVDEVFRCISGSVAVSAFELRSLPLPTAEAMTMIEKLISANAPRASVELALLKLYGIAT
ncbi:HsdM family class I SAM-dependent methyltransferase [Rhizobium leguminosarum]|uniref:HsdM family class I SAM-dependent methyltransferase n=1 Tax=Rhizobium leguminosarum TaxID=384 RepID=UPI0010379E48|nr:N-6 DNA methylase [Rhizobium leguminosarum]TBF85688.1 SAM-dependent methyltransferase [Rhizobium leguminosarum]